MTGQYRRSDRIGRLKLITGTSNSFISKIMASQAKETLSQKRKANIRLIIWIVIFTLIIALIFLFFFAELKSEEDFERHLKQHEKTD